MKKLSFNMIILTCFLLIAIAGCSNGGNSTEETSAESNNKENVSLDGDVEIVVPASAGGGSDINARMLADVINESGLIDENVMVLNKPGGSTAVANSYTYSKEGFNNTIMTWNSSQQISPILNDNDVTLDDLTPLGTLALDSYLFVVREDSEYESFDETLEASRENPDTITIGGTGQGTEVHMLGHLINKYGEGKFKYVSFDSGGETMSALLGGHIDVILSNPNEALSQISAGELKALATTSAESLSGELEDVPTFSELGYPEIELTSFRGYVGPPGMTEEEIMYWENILKQVHETETWQKEYVEKYDLQAQNLNAEESKEFYQEVLDQYLDASKEMGLIE